MSALSRNGRHLYDVIYSLKTDVPFIWIKHSFHLKMRAVDVKKFPHTCINGKSKLYLNGFRINLQFDLNKINKRKAFDNKIKWQTIISPRVIQCKFSLISKSRDRASLCVVLFSVFRCKQQINMDDSVDVLTTVLQLHTRRPKFCSTLSNTLWNE